MKILVDTNILIAAEPTTEKDIEYTTEDATLLINISQRGKHDMYIHPASLRDIKNDKDSQRRKTRLLLLNKYLQLENPPRFNDVSRGSQEIMPNLRRDTVDNHLLAAVYFDVVDYLITEDRGIHKMAKYLEISDRVLTLNDIIKTLRALLPKEIEPPPAVRAIKCYELNEQDPIFQSFRVDYPEFDAWLKRCKINHRDAFIIACQNTKYGAMSIIKSESEGDQKHGFTGRILKICSFKDAVIGKGYGELLLKTIFDKGYIGKYDCIYVEVLPKYGGLIDFFNTFGFENHTGQTQRGEKVLIKYLNPTRGIGMELSPLEYHIRYGPKYIKTDGVSAYIIPIQPQFHKVLFPELQQQLELMQGIYAFGNTIRKAYLCNSPMKAIPAGSVVFFYRSRDRRAIHSVGVVENTIRSSNPSIIERFVGPRTVYSEKEIVDLCTQGEVLAIRFRCAQPLIEPIKYLILKKNLVLSAVPQSIVKINEGGWKWLQDKLLRLH